MHQFDSLTQEKHFYSPILKSKAHRDWSSLDSLEMFHQFYSNCIQYAAYYMHLYDMDQIIRSTTKSISYGPHYMAIWYGLYRIRIETLLYLLHKGYQLPLFRYNEPAEILPENFWNLYLDFKSESFQSQLKYWVQYSWFQWIRPWKLIKLGVWSLWIKVSLQSEIFSSAILFVSAAWTFSLISDWSEGWHRNFDVFNFASSIVTLLISALFRFESEFSLNANLK